MIRALPFLVFVVVAACATAPTQEMSDARQAVQAAVDAGAGTHAPDALHQAESHLNQAGESIESGQYRDARHDAVAAKNEAIDAREMAHAIGSARAAIEQAENSGVLSDEARDLLTRAEEAASKFNALMAVRLANEARNQAEQDLRRASPQ